MKILIVRHGDPNYEIDGLTERGKIEAELLSERLIKETDPQFYCSILGRARLTVVPTLERLGAVAEYCDWLQEFSYERIATPDGNCEHLAWDLMPAWLRDFPALYLPNEWKKVPMIRESGIPKAYD